MAEKQAQLLKVQEERDILQAMATTRGVASVTGDSASGVQSPVIDGGEQTPKDVSKIADASASELQRMKNKLQNVNSILGQQDRKIAGLERSLASSQNLARQREDEINKLQDRLYESESDSRRKIEKLTTYTQNLVKAIEKKELERDEKKAEIYRLHARLEEKEKEIAKNHEDMKQVTFFFHSLTCVHSFSPVLVSLPLSYQCLAWIDSDPCREPQGFPGVGERAPQERRGSQIDSGGAVADPDGDKQEDFVAGK
jgi:ABC-type transporter Mla subunit MlaD